MKRKARIKNAAILALILVLASPISAALCEAGEYAPVIVNSVEEMDATAASLYEYAVAQRTKLLEEMSGISDTELIQSAVGSGILDSADTFTRTPQTRVPKSVIMFAPREAMDHLSYYVFGAAEGEAPDEGAYVDMNLGAFAPGAALTIGDTVHTNMSDRYTSSLLGMFSLLDLAKLDDVPCGGFVLTFYDEDLPQVLTMLYPMEDEHTLTRTQFIYPWYRFDDHLEGSDNFTEPLRIIHRFYGWSAFDVTAYKPSGAEDN